MNKMICHHITALQIRALKANTPHKGGMWGTAVPSSVYDKEPHSNTFWFINRPGQNVAQKSLLFVSHKLAKLLLIFTNISKFHSSNG